MYRTPLYLLHLTLPYGCTVYNTMIYITCKNFGRFKFRTNQVIENNTIRNFSASKIFQYSIKILRSSLVSFVRRTLVETLLERINGLIEFLLFSRQCIPKPWGCSKTIIFTDDVSNLLISYVLIEMRIKVSKN